MTDTTTPSKPARALPDGFDVPAHPFHVPAELRHLYTTLTVSDSELERTFADFRARVAHQEALGLWEAECTRRQRDKPQGYPRWLHESTTRDGQPRPSVLSDLVKDAHSFRRADFVHPLTEDQRTLATHITYLRAAESHVTSERTRKAEEANYRARQTCPFCKAAPVAIVMDKDGNRSCAPCQTLYPILKSALTPTGEHSTRLDALLDHLARTGAIPAHLPKLSLEELDAMLDNPDATAPWDVAPETSSQTAAESIGRLRRVLSRMLGN